MDTNRLKCARNAIAFSIEVETIAPDAVSDRASNPVAPTIAQNIQAEEKKSEGNPLFNDPDSFRDREYDAGSITGIKRRDPFAESYTRRYRNDYQKLYRDENGRKDQ